MLACPRCKTALTSTERKGESCTTAMSAAVRF